LSGESCIPHGYSPDNMIGVIRVANSRILIVDDEELIRDLIKEYISLENFVADEAVDGIQALQLFKQFNYDLIILDVMMPGMDGWSLCREIRKTSQVPVIMLTARGEEYDKLLGFELGVDDYMVKPFSPRELLARMKAIMRRSVVRDEPDDYISFEGLTIIFDSHNVYVDDNLVNLTPKEYDLLSFFARNTNRAYGVQAISLKPEARNEKYTFKAVGRYDDISGNSSYTAMAFSNSISGKFLYPHESKRY